MIANILRIFQDQGFGTFSVKALPLIPSFYKPDLSSETDLGILISFENVALLGNPAMHVNPRTHFQSSNHLSIPTGAISH